MQLGVRAHLLSPEEGSCYILSTWNNCCKSLASYGVIFQSDFQPYQVKRPKIYDVGQFDKIKYNHPLRPSHFVKIFIFFLLILRSTKLHPFKHTIIARSHLQKISCKWIFLFERINVEVWGRFGTSTLIFSFQTVSQKLASMLAKIKFKMNYCTKPNLLKYTHQHLIWFKMTDQFLLCSVFEGWTKK